MTSSSARADDVPGAVAAFPRRLRLGAVALASLVCAVVGASCALTFSDYEVEVGSTGTGSGGEGGKVEQGGRGW